MTWLSGKLVTPSSPTKRRRSSSSKKTWKFRPVGRRWQPISWPRNTSTAHWKRVSVRRSARQLVGRVVDTMTRWGREGGYFASHADAETFHDELSFLLLNQYASFNSPVWFNCGIEAKPQCSACFINSVEDTMESILGLARTEGMLFKWGSGTGSNLSPLRSSRERLSGGGIASGPVSFMKGYDAFAGVIRSGGKTRRAAKMVILNATIRTSWTSSSARCGRKRKAWALIDAGYDPSFNGDAYSSIFYQNANHSVRVTDDFMQCRPRGRRMGNTPVSLTGEAARSIPAPGTSSTKFRRARTSAVTRACSSTRPSTAGIHRKAPGVSMRRIPVRSTCTSMTAPATWPLST